MFPEVTRLLTSHTGNTSNSEDILSSVCYTVRNLMTSQPQMARQYFSSGMINNIINLCRSRWVGRGAPALHPSEKARTWGATVPWWRGGGLTAEAQGAWSRDSNSQASGQRTSHRGHQGTEFSEGWQGAGALTQGVGALFCSRGSLLPGQGLGGRHGDPVPFMAPENSPGEPPGGWGAGLSPLCRVSSPRLKAAPVSCTPRASPGVRVRVGGRKACSHASRSLTHKRTSPRPVHPPRPQKLPGASCLTCGPARSCRVSSDR